MKWALWGVKINSDYLLVRGEEGSCQLLPEGREREDVEGSPGSPTSARGHPGRAWVEVSEDRMLRLTLCPEAARRTAEAWPHLELLWTPASPAGEEGPCHPAALQGAGRGAGG